jgi:hypothetical protein
VVTLEALQQAMMGAAATPETTPTVGDLLHPEVLRGALESAGMAAALQGLRQLLPEQDRADPGGLLEVLRSPALRAQAAALTSAMASGGVADLLASFGLPAGDPPAAANAVGASGLQAFFRSLRQIPRKDPDRER